MSLMHRLASAILAAPLIGTGVAMASGFPDKPVRMVVPYPAGGTSDILGRLIQEPFRKATGQNLVVDNRPGGASVIGTSAVARAAPDGYTILLADLALLVNPALIKDIPYDTTRDFTAIVGGAKAPLVLLIHQDVPANTLAELMALARQKPGTINYGSGGYGSSTHIAGEMFRKATALDLIHVPFQGVAPVMNALLGGHVNIYFGGTTTALPHLASKKLKALAITGDKRSPLLPDVPTFRESGVEGMNAQTYWGFYAPAGTDPARLDALNKAIREAMKDPAVQKRTAELGLEPIDNTPHAQQKAFVDMVRYWGDFIRETGIKVD